MTEKKFIDDGGFAFPRGPDDAAGWRAEGGMSLRDWFAGQSLTRDNIVGTPEQIAEMAYQIADAMIAESKRV